MLRRNSILILVLCLSLLFGVFATVQAQEQKKIEIAYGGQAYFVDGMRKGIEYYEEKNPDVDIELNVIPGDLWEKIKVLLASGSAPDLMRMDDEIYPSFAITGVLADITDQMKEDPKVNMDDYWDFTLELYDWEGRYYAIPTHSGVVVMMYNKDLLDEAGVPYPEGEYPYDQFVEDTKKLTVDEDGDGNIDQYGFGLRQWWPYWQTWIWRWGGSIYNREMTESTINHPKSIEGMQKMVDLMQEHEVAPSAAVQREEGGEGGGYNLFKGGRMAFWEEGPWPLNDLMNVEDQNFDFGPVVDGPYGKATRVTADSLAMSADSDQPDLAWEVMSEVTGKEFQEFMGRQGMLPSYKSVSYSENYAYNPDTDWDESVFLEAAENYARVSEITLNYAKMDDRFAEYVEEVLLGKKDVETAFNQMKPVLDDLLDERDVGRWEDHYKERGVWDQMLE